MAVAEVKALACQLPAETGVPLSLWSCPELAREAVTRGIVESVSASTVARWLAADALKPWQYLQSISRGLPARVSSEGSGPRRARSTPG
nr:hypothetical protein [Saccharopolyspora pogona]